MRIPLAAPDITEAEIEAVASVLRTGRLSLGPQLEEFEHCLGKYIGAPHTIAVSSGTAALHLCLHALGITEGDEVIVPSFAFIAVANAVRYQNAIPVFVDIEPQTLNLDPARIESAITHKTRAIIVVHTFGCSAELHEIQQIAQRHSLFLIEDACEALGAEYHGKKCGLLGDAGVFGFYPNKQITTGEGGAIVAHNAGFAHLVRGLRNQGRVHGDGIAEHGELGYNYRISEMSCALGKTQLQRIDSILLRRKTLARIYIENLRGNRHILTPPLMLPHRTISWFTFVVRLSSSLGQGDRDWILEQMTAHGIGCARYFVPIHLQPVYRRELYKTQGLPITECVAARSLALPFFNRMEEHAVQEVCLLLSELVEQRTCEAERANAVQR